MRQVACWLGAAAAVALAGCASSPEVAVVDRPGEIAPCRTQAQADAGADTRQFGSCLAWADKVAETTKPTAASLDATRWGLPIMQAYLDRTSRDSATSAPAAQEP